MVEEKDIKAPKYKLTRKDVQRLLNRATRIPSKAKELKQRTKNRIITAITAAFAFVIALVWKDAIRKIVDAIIENLNIPETAYLHEIIIALIVTVICVVGIMIISRSDGNE